MNDREACLAAVRKALAAESRLKEACRALSLSIDDGVRERDADQSRRQTPRLTGAVQTDVERHIAECDAWYVFGVDDVINEIKVVPG
jgi:hypothetical protein